MQVKCWKQSGASGAIVPTSIVADIERYGSAVLNTWITPRGTYSSGNSIILEGAQFRGDHAAYNRSDVLYILGGRRSISHWFRLHGSSPEICDPTSKGLYGSVLRKKRRFEKDLTVVMISRFKVPVVPDGWTVYASYNLLSCPEAKVSSVTGSRIAEFSPTALADIFDRMFVDRVAA